MTHHPDGIGEPILDNCQVISWPVMRPNLRDRHSRIAKAKRISDRAKGIEKPSRGHGARFEDQMEAQAQRS